MAAAAAASSRRRRRPRGHPNPLFARWLREWRDEARGTWARGTYERVCFGVPSCVLGCLGVFWGAQVGDFGVSRCILGCPGVFLGSPDMFWGTQALRSLARFPLPLPSGRAAAILQHFGPALCARLDQRLRQHRRGPPPHAPSAAAVPGPSPSPAHRESFPHPSPTQHPPH
ncbi:hypothetical protein DV515_00018691 [Chloebia gouldiae]|uniref:Crossover junction endonuclease MUS81-like HHH domain-containing protein n=1 Tax=Chloebia gouldiae TaxID=44316 RepID=A0A3L8Q6T2_CHLGU|nr:hypothetical protein DV515_00018691 [Chloebia gouldiae]